MYFEEFFVCSNCKYPLFEKKEIEHKKEQNCCPKCGINIANTFNNTLAYYKKNKKQFENFIFPKIKE